jgi:hypothetical protein
MIIRAIAHFYRGEDEECERCLEAVDPVSAPARLVSPIANMLEDQPQDGAAGKLQNAVKGA